MPAEHVIAPLDVATVRDAVTALAARLVDSGAVRQPERLDRLFADARLRDVIHVGDRVLLPHLRTDAVDRLVMALGVTPDPLPAAPGDAAGIAQVVVLVLAPPPSTELYLQTLSALARALRHDDVVDAIAAARTPAEVLAVPALRRLAIEPRLTVRDVMTDDVQHVTPEEGISRVLELVSHNRLRGIPVVGDAGEVLGMVTDRDLLRYLLPRAGRGDAAERTAGDAEPKVREIMSRSVMCISEDQPLHDVASLMINKDVERLPVVSEGRLTGFLTRGDILRKLFGLRPH